MEQLGYAAWDDDKPIVAGWPVQFLPAVKPLELEALAQAVVHKLNEKVTVSVLRPEHLMALALDLGRPKDRVRLEQFWRSEAYDQARLRDLLARHHLSAKWERLLALFSGGDDAEGGVTRLS